MMKTLHKFYTIMCLALCIYSLGISADPVSAQNTVPESMGTLTFEEQAWLKAHPYFVLGASTDYPPMVIKRADGTYVGVLVDLFEAVSRYLDTRIGLHVEDSWADIQEKAQNREIDGLAFGARDPSRDALYNATDMVVSTYFSVFGRSRFEYQIERFSDLDGMRIGYKKAARPTRSLLEKLPSAILVPFDSHESMTQALLRKEIDVIVAWMSYDHWRKDRMQGTIDNIYFIEEYPIEQVTYVRNDWPELIPILNKAIAALQKDDLPRIINKWFGDWPQRSAATRLPLTPEEQAWLDRKQTVRVRIVDYPPYLIVKDDQPPQGIVVEYLKLIGERTGIRFKHDVTDQPFAEFLDKMKQRRGPDMTAVIVPTAEREQYISFSNTYIASPYVIFTREQDNPILDISGLTGRTLAVPRRFVVQEKLDRDYPQIRQALYDSDAAALQAVATGQADAYIGNLTVASHIIHRRGFSHLRVAAASPFGEQALSMGNRNDWPELTSIINKALASITEEEKTAIRSKYLAIKYEQGIDKAQVLKWVLIVGGSTVGIILVFVFWNRQMSREIRKRKQTEKDLKKARDDAEDAQRAAEAANQAKSIFLANMSHELRTPLNAILGFSDMLTRQNDTTTAQQERLAIINRSGKHLLSMINAVLDLSKIEAGAIELQENPFDLVALIQEISLMIQSRATENGLSVAVETESISVPDIKADMGKLRQILINLLSNAVKFTKEGGVTIRCNIEPIAEKPDRCQIVIEVEDSGPGIDPAIQASIFEPFVRGIDTSVRKGTGLGLSICKKYAQIMGGTIELESEVGKGSLFRVRLPAQVAKSTDVRISADGKPKVTGIVPTDKTWRILVADDNRENLLLLKSLLEEVGFFVLEAKDGEEAVAAFKKESPDLIWMDMRMPVMDGYEATRLIRDLPGGDTVKIVAITASAFQEQRPDILAVGCDEVVYKPFQDHEVFETMGQLLDAKYLFEEKGEAATRKESVELTAEMLADLPGELLQELRETILALNREAAMDVIARVGDQAPEVAAGLQKLVDNFQMVELRDLLGEVA